jgi:hypothetical protein
MFVFHVETSLWDSRKGSASRSWIEERKGAAITGWRVSRDWESGTGVEPVTHAQDAPATQTLQGKIKSGRILARLGGKSSKKCGKGGQNAQFY